MVGLQWTSGTAVDWQRLGYVAGASALVVILVTEVIVLYVRGQAQRQKDLPPGPQPWPMVGNLPALAGAMLHQNLQQLAAKFGPVMYLRLGSVPCVVVSTAEVARALVRASDEHLLSRPKLLSFSILSENRTMGTAPGPGKLWHSLRKFGSSELLSVNRVASYEGSRREELSNMMQVLLETSNKGEAINLKFWLFQTAANLTTRMLVNKRIYYGSKANSYQEEIEKEFEQVLKDRVHYLTAPVISDYVPWLRFFSETMQGWRSKMEAHRDREMSLFGKILELDKRRKRAAKGEADASYIPGFVDVMMEAPVDNGKVLDDKFIIKQAVEYFTAAVETSSTALELAMAELVANPEIMKRAQEEVDTIAGKDRLVQESDIPNLPFLTAVMKETFRMHPSLPLGFPRESTAPIEALGYKIPARTRITFSAYAIHRDPAVYEHPDEFNPNRFLQQHRNVNHLAAFDSYELIPFGVGRRMCPGFNLGNIIVLLMLANLMHSYDWCVPDGGSVDPIDAEIKGLVLCLRNPLSVLPKHREGVPAF
ncbi:hypothetical protein KC19_3G145500 [Ceratodon purpureus]|uniref:Cytochrome P450 n=2 Tax=Ceratodon purpureus TaxID=3225 RepID=A0A8T0IKJ3_CERPU|nr:hypothetical protein KC19_3G145500 [Ceratodon purpureus]